MEYNPSEHQITVFRQTIVTTRRRLTTDFEDINGSSIDDIGIEGFLEFIDRHRLTYMPHRGSHWDKVLKWAEYFAVQISGYATTLEAFVPESKAASQLIWTALQAMLRVSHSS